MGRRRRDKNRNKASRNPSNGDGTPHRANGNGSVPATSASSPVPRADLTPTPAATTGAEADSNGSERPVGPVRRLLRHIWGRGIREEVMAGLVLLLGAAAYLFVSEWMDRREVRRERWEDYLLARYEHMDQLEERFSNVMTKNQAFAQILVSEALNMEYLRRARDTNGELLKVLPTDLRTFEQVRASWEEHRRIWLRDIEHYDSVCSRAHAEIAAVVADFGKNESLAVKANVARAFVRASRSLLNIWHPLSQVDAAHLEEQAQGLENAIDKLLVDLGTELDAGCESGSPCHVKMEALTNVSTNKASDRGSESDKKPFVPCPLHKLKAAAGEIRTECTRLKARDPKADSARQFDDEWVQAHKLHSLLSSASFQMSNYAAASLREVNAARVDRLNGSNANMNGK